MASPHPPHGDARRALNAQLAVRALELGSGVALHRPAHVYLQVASACNLDCYMCSEHNRPENERHGRGLKSMPLDVFEAIERDVFPWSRRTCIGVGGEPTIAPRFTEYIERAARAGQEIHLTTNGTRFDHGRIAEVVAKNCAHVFVSIDAATAPTYERIRRGSQWNKLQSGMQKLRQHREAGGAPRGRLTLAFVLMRSNPIAGGNARQNPESGMSATPSNQRPIQIFFAKCNFACEAPLDFFIPRISCHYRGTHI